MSFKFVNYRYWDSKSYIFKQNYLNSEYLLKDDFKKYEEKKFQKLNIKDKIDYCKQLYLQPDNIFQFIINKIKLSDINYLIKFMIENSNDFNEKNINKKLTNYTLKILYFATDYETNNFLLTKFIDNNINFFFKNTDGQLSLLLCMIIDKKFQYFIENDGKNNCIQFKKFLNNMNIIFDKINETLRVYKNEKKKHLIFILII